MDRAGTPPRRRKCRKRPYLQHLPGHRWWRLEVDRGVDGGGGWPSQLLLLLLLLLHVMHDRLLLHAFSLLLLLRLLPHELHAQPDARCHGGCWFGLPVVERRQVRDVFSIFMVSKRGLA